MKRRKQLNKMIGRVVSVMFALLMVVSMWGMMPREVRAEDGGSFLDSSYKAEFATSYVQDPKITSFKYNSYISENLKLEYNEGEVFNLNGFGSDFYFSMGYFYPDTDDPTLKKWDNINGRFISDSNGIATHYHTGDVFSNTIVKFVADSQPLKAGDTSVTVTLQWVEANTSASCEVPITVIPKATEPSTEVPTEAPTVKPTQTPTKAPVVTPTVKPTESVEAPSTSEKVETPTQNATGVEKETEASTEAETMASTENTSTESVSTEVESSVQGIHTVKGQLKYKDGTPLASTYIELHSVVKTGYTDENGYYEFTGVEPGKHTLTAFNENKEVIGEFSLTVGDDATALVVENAFTVEADAPVKEPNMAGVWTVMVLLVVTAIVVTGVFVYRRKNKEA